MAELARGSVADRPWGLTLGALGRRGLTGELTLRADGKAYVITFDGGAIVAASSPWANDAAVRVALTGGLISSTQVADLSRRLAAAGGRDEIEVIAEAARLAPELAHRLRRRLIAQRAARTFSIERGDFSVDDQSTLPVVPGSELDIRSVIYLGARSNLTEDRLAAELAHIGQWFQIKPEAQDDLPQFGFTDVERPVLSMLVDGANLIDVELGNGRNDLDIRGVRAIVYALACCGACEISRDPKGTPRTRPPTPDDNGRTRVGYSSGVPDRPRSGSSGNHRAMPAPRDSSPSINNPDRAQSGSGAYPAVSRAPTPSSGAHQMPRPPASFRTPSQSGIPGEPRTRTPSMPPMNRQPGSPTSSPVRTPGESGSFRSGDSSAPPPGGDGIRVRTPSVAPSMSRTITGTTNPGTARVRSPSGAIVNVPISADRARRTSAAPPVGGTQPPPNVARTKSATVSPVAALPGVNRPRRRTDAALETEALIAEKVPLLDNHADHFKLLGVLQDATADQVRTAYFGLARKLHPDRIAALGIDDSSRNAQRLFAQINAAFAVLNDPKQRENYVAMLRRGGESAVRAQDSAADELALKVMRAEEAFRRGEMALRREQLAQAVTDFQTALELQPNEPEYQAMAAWTVFAAAPDKNSIVGKTRHALQRAADATQTSPTARFYLGRVERMMGREKEALAHFQEVLRIKPGHSEASSEVRILEQRLRGRR